MRCVYICYSIHGLFRLPFHLVRHHLNVYIYAAASIFASLLHGIIVSLKSP